MGSKVQFWGPISLCLCAFLGLEVGAEVLRRVFRREGCHGRRLEDGLKGRSTPFADL